jgi:CRISPR-associated protein Cas5t
VLGIRNPKGEGEPHEQGCKGNNGNCTFCKLKKLKISIAGRFQSKTTEYTWFRNLSKKSHVTRFGSTEIREISGHIEHIGGQSPVSIDILNEVELFIYLAHDEEDFLIKVKDNLENPIQRLYPLHLGRAEDWIVFREEPTLVDLQEKIPDGNYHHFFWIPEDYVCNGQTPGLRYRVPTFYTLNNGVRNFEYEGAFLNDGKIIGLKGYFDNEIRIPVFFSKGLDHDGTK